MTDRGGSRIAMQTDTLRVEVMPAMGGKIASLRWLPGDVELLQAPLAPYAPRTMEMGFEESDASGWDECLPSVAACMVKTEPGVVSVPDHGDFWRLEWECEQAGNEMRMAATGVSLPLRLERTLKLSGNALEVEYRVENAGRAAVEYAWSAHPLFAVEAGDRIVLPASVKQVRVEGSKRLGRKGAVHGWPRCCTASESGGGASVDLSVAGDIQDGVGDKVFAEAPPEGWAAIERRRQGVRVEMSFDAHRTPWLGLWLCYGGWPEGKANRQQCVAIEPCTAPVDSLAEAQKHGWARRLDVGESAAWPLEVRVRAVGEVR
jgi:galactose mutarotase-like enzyme